MYFLFHFAKFFTLPCFYTECTFGNRTYANGERLEENPNGPCKVCYCRGGEIQCNDVGCYTRDDCEPVQVPGQCCPKYDNCPPRGKYKHPQTHGRCYMINS